MEKIFVGIDGGGTKTALAAGRADGVVAARARIGSASWRERGVDGVAAMLAEAVKSLGIGPVGGVAAGLPCFGESSQGDIALRAALESAFSGIPVYLTNDVEAGWAGAFALEPGVHLVSGTGSIAYGRDGEGNCARCGGWDEFFSDEGSSYWLARRGMELFSKQSDGRVEAGPLLELIRAEFSLSRDADFIDLFQARFRGSREAAASFQPWLEKAARLGDNAARALYAEAAAELCLMARAIQNRLRLPEEGFRVSYTGGTFKAGELILEPLSEGIAALGGMLTTPARPPEEGALLMAIDKFAN